MTKLVIFVSIALFFPSILTQCNIPKARVSFKRSIYEFALGLTSRIAQETDNNFVFSPLTLWGLIATLSAGTDDSTYSEIEKTLLYHPHKCFNERYLEILREVLVSSEGLNVKRSSLIVIDEDLKVLKEFDEKIKRSQISQLLTPSFESSIDAVNVINTQVHQDTRGSVSEVLTAEEVENQYILLIDALFFNGKWKYAINPEEVEPSMFYDEATKPIGDVDLLLLTAVLNYTDMPIIGADVLELPYENPRFSLLIILPEPNSTVTQVFDSLKMISLRSIFSTFARQPAKSVMAQFPKLEISTNLENLNELLDDMGLNAMFRPESSFPYVSDLAVYVSDVKQKVDFKLSEEGSESVQFDFVANDAPVYFNANKPFVFIVVDKVVEVPLFIGAYSKPSE